MTTVRVQHNSMEFSDSSKEHAHDAQAVFAHAREHRVWFVTGTEAGSAPGHRDLRAMLLNQARMHGYHGYFNEYGDWACVSMKYCHKFRFGFMGPFIEGTHGKSAAQGGHAPRGIAWIQGEAVKGKLGRLTVGSSHWLTERAMAQTHETNAPMVKGQAQFGEKYGSGTDVVFSCGDANVNDLNNDIFRGHPFTTIADELHKHPPTHEGGNAIDFIASHDRDGRVKGKAYRVLGDKQLKLYSDHKMLLATYEIAPIPR